MYIISNKLVFFHIYIFTFYRIPFVIKLHGGIFNSKDVSRQKDRWTICAVRVDLPQTADVSCVPQLILRTLT